MSSMDARVIQYNACPSVAKRRREYYPFGLQTSASWTRENTKGNNYLYNAANELNQSTQWYETFFRGYDPALGRFLQVDPLSFSEQATYQYAGNNPVIFNDPIGLSKMPITWAFIQWLWDNTPDEGKGSWSEEGYHIYKEGSAGEGGLNNYEEIEAKEPYQWTVSGVLDKTGQYLLDVAYTLLRDNSIIASVSMEGRVLQDNIIVTPEVEVTASAQQGDIQVLQAGTGVSTDEFRNLLDGMLITAEGYFFKEELAIEKALKSGAKGERHLLKAGLKNVKALGTAAGVLAVGLSWWEASEKGTTGAYSLATVDTIVAGATLICPALAPIALGYGVIRLGLDLADVDVAGEIDQLIK